MSNTQEIIVYRNPAEKAMWDLLMSGDSFPVIMFFVSYLIFLIIYFNLIEKLKRKSNKKLASFINFLSKSYYIGFILMAVPSYFVYRFFVI